MSAFAGDTLLGGGEEELLAEGNVISPNIVDNDSTVVFTHDKRFVFGPAYALTMANISLNDTGNYTLTVDLVKREERAPTRDSNTVSLTVYVPTKYV
nr:hypothetical protein BaRGS_029465 [Batillaria attramentaria]